MNKKTQNLIPTTHLHNNTNTKIATLLFYHNQQLFLSTLVLSLYISRTILLLNRSTTATIHCHSLWRWDRLSSVKIIYWHWLTASNRSLCFDRLDEFSFSRSIDILHPSHWCSKWPVAHYTHIHWSTHNLALTLRSKGRSTSSVPLEFENILLFSVKN